MSIPQELYPSQDDPLSLKLNNDPSHIEDFIEFLLNSGRWQEAAERLAGVLNDDTFYSTKGKTKHRLWLELCDLLTQHDVVSGLNADAIIRGAIRKFADDQVGRLWTALAYYYVRSGLFEKARDVFEEVMTTIATDRDFSVIFDAYSRFEESMLLFKMEGVIDEDEQAEDDDDDDDDDEDDHFDVAKIKRKLKRFWLYDDKDVELTKARFEHLLDRRPELANSVLLRQDPHNVEQWHQRVKLFEGNRAKQILTYTEAVRTVDPMKAVGKPHTLWVAFAKLYYEDHKDIVNARAVFDKAVRVNYKTVDNLASVWCEWAEIEVRHKNFEGALELMRRATAEVKQRSVATDGNEPVQCKLHKSLRLWAFYVDLEESLGTLESTRAVYERILDLKIATPQIITNYAMLLEEHKFFEDAFKVYERGVKIFKYPHVKDIWVTYLSKFVKRYGKSKLERGRELFEHAIEATPAESVKPLYLRYAKLEEDYGLAKQAMKVYDRSTKAVPPHEKLSMYEIYIARAAEIFGVPRTREIYRQAIESGLPGKDVKTMCMKYAELEKSLGEIDRARGVFIYASRFADPRSDPDVWNKWNEFEVNHGNKDTFREMLRIRRSVSASYTQKHFILPEHLMQKDKQPNLDEAILDALKKAGAPEDETAALEKQLLPDASKTATKDSSRKVVLGFVSAGVESQTDGGLKVATNHEDLELPEESDSEDDERVEIAQEDAPSAVFCGLVRKREECANNDGNGDDIAATEDTDEAHLGALERIKRQRRGAMV
ncbi:hypothetical protein RHSIM_RhsimUnG0236300 [Rhododendron simsii]|uniref:Pre-mRNA-splicing factor SYF1 n=1 Tax=Rhododendron simsii TaxID=118357 RepID=A0A834L3S8_RHOSS|nr:hypothetical protein RHSIM_RhsimUnG0236300 [Rhododendron simsii]